MRRIWLITGLSGLLVAGVAAAQDAARRDADTLQRKLTLVLERGSQSAPTATRPLRTPVSDREVNAYFQFQGREYLPVGVLDPALTIMDASRIEARAIVDLDAVRQAQPRAWSDPLAWVGGKLELRAVGRLRAANGQGTLELDSATLGGVPIPTTLVREVVSHYSRTPDTPGGFDLSQPFALPHQIRQVELRRGSAVIVQ